MNGRAMRRPEGIENLFFQTFRKLSLPKAHPVVQQMLIDGRLDNHIFVQKLNTLYDEVVLLNAV